MQDILQQAVLDALLAAVTPQLLFVLAILLVFKGFSLAKRSVNEITPGERRQSARAAERERIKGLRGPYKGYW